MDLYRSNNANDFQPTTQDPQSGVGSNLQTPANDLQPVPSSQDGQQNFPTTNRLEVLGVDNPASSSRQPETTQPESNGIDMSTIAGLLLFAVFAAALLWWALKAYNDADTFEPTAEPEKGPQPETAPTVAPNEKTQAKKKPSVTKKKGKAKKRRKKTK